MENKQMGELTSEAVKVNIFDQTYSLRSFKGEEHIRRIALLVDERMRQISAHTTSFELSRIAVLAALNIADELLTLTVELEEAQAATLPAQADEQLEELEPTPSAQASEGGEPPKPQTWFDEIFDTEVPTKDRRERLSSQISNKLQALRREDPKALNISLEEDE
jgi:cell division protein ZapA (FtsZ GTPase activity inhibitor)